MRYIYLLIAAIFVMVLVFNPSGMVHWFESDEMNREAEQTRFLEQDSPKATKAKKEKAFENELAQQVSAVADRYEQNIRFPNYSIPIGEGQTDLLEPYSAPVVPLNIDPEMTGQASLSPAQFIFFHGDTIEAKLVTTGTIEATQVSIKLVKNNDPLASFNVKKEGTLFLAKLDNSADDWPVDLHIRADFHFGEYGKVSLLSPIKYSPNNGEISSVGAAYVDGVNLALPVMLKINTAGRYRLSANLFDENMRPLAHLNAKQNLKQGDNTWVLNVHSEVLRAAHNAGPYILDTWTLTKLPERPGIATSFGKSQVNKINVKGFPLNDYDDTPWQDPKDQARLEFLRKLQAER